MQRLEPFPEEFRKIVLRILPILLKKFPGPFHLFYEDGIRQCLRGIRSSFKAQGLDIMEYFALKANPRLQIARTVLDEGFGLDVSSSAELAIARMLGAEPDKIMLTSNNTPQSLLAEAVAGKGCILNFDGEIYVNKVPDPFPQLMCVRLNPGTRKTGDEVNQIIGNPVDAKFGQPIERIARPYELGFARGATTAALHAMICSNDRDYKHMVNTVALGFEVIDQLTSRFGQFAFFNHGGGHGPAYRPDEKPFDMDAFAADCLPIVERFKAKHNYAPRLCMESGRFVTGPSGILVNRVINRFYKYKQFVGVETGMQGVPRVALYQSAYHHPIVLRPDGVLKDGPSEKVTIVGGVCESNDIIARDVDLPRIEEGDIIITCTSGAHCNGQASQYNMQPRPQELFLESGNKVRRICREETLDDFLSRQMGLDGPEHVVQL